MCLEDEADARVDGCNHLFCEGCISTWCYSHNQANCPTCRAGIAEIRCATTGDVLHKLTEGPNGQAGAALCADTLSHEAGAAFILKQRNMRESRTLKTTQSGAADSEMDNGSGIADAEDGDGGDVVNGSSAADTGADTDDPIHNMVEQLMALNSTGSSSKASVKASTSTPILLAEALSISRPLLACAWVSAVLGWVGVGPPAPAQGEACSQSLRGWSSSSRRTPCLNGWRWMAARPPSRR